MTKEMESSEKGWDGNVSTDGSGVVVFMWAGALGIRDDEIGPELWVLLEIRRVLREWTEN